MDTGRYFGDGTRLFLPLATAVFLLTSSFWLSAAAPGRFPFAPSVVHADGPPNVSMSFPANNAIYSTSTFRAGCDTPNVFDVCGTASAEGANIVTGVRVSLQQLSSGNCT
jgi:hypothetical protein